MQMDLYKQIYNQIYLLMFVKNKNNLKHSQLFAIDVISTVQATCDDGVPSSLAYLRSSPVTKSHGVP